MQTPTTDQLRQRIDSGATGEKVSMPDPAAAPLGTDAEAGGVPPTAEERALEAREAPSRSNVSPRAAPGRLIYIALLLVVAVALVMIAVLARP